MLTLYIFYPVLIISYLAYLITKKASKTTIFLNALFIVIGTVLAFGTPWILSFILFIDIFPTYIVILITIILMKLLPLKKCSTIIKIFIFILLSTIIGLNTNLVLLSKNLLKQDRKINEVIKKKLIIKNGDFVELKGRYKNIPIRYNKFDFLTFGSNEGCMCGYWIYPKIERSNIIPYLLSIKEIPFSWVKPSDKKIVIDYKEANKTYRLSIKIFQKKRLLSSLVIKDHLPFQDKNSKKRDLENFDNRLKYLIRHNIWNAILYYSNITKVDNKETISNFLDKSINRIKKDKNWAQSTTNITATLLYSSNLQLCTTDKSDDYRYYPFNTWNRRKRDYSIKLSPKPNRFIFNDNNITYTTLSHTKKFFWYGYITNYKTPKYFLVFRIFSKPFRVVLYKFDHQGDFLQEIHIKLPKSATIGGRNWHPISHIKVINNKINFRVYSIYERHNKKNRCSYIQVEIKMN